jgi:Golgi SNAP receptor complex protein 2
MISELFPEEKRRLNDLELQLAQLESNSDALLKPSDVYAGLTEMEFRLGELDKLADKENSKARREDYRRRIQHLRNIYNHIKESLDQIVRRKYPMSFDAKRQQLFSGADLEGGLTTQQELDENSSLNRSSSMVNSYLDVGQHTLTELLNQKERLKNAHRKVIDILNYLGLSNSLMRAIESRDVTDRLIVYGGMVFILLLLLGLWWFFR